MAKRQRTNLVTASFHYLVKRQRRFPDSDEVGFSQADFSRLVERLKDTSPIDFEDDNEIARIKHGDNIPLLQHTEINPQRHFGLFEGAYYGQPFRNTKVGPIDPDSLNLRKFHYLVDHRRDGKIVVGVQYLGNYGDYEGIASCFMKTLQTNESVVLSKSIASVRHEIGDGTPVELKVTLRKRSNKTGGASLFSRSAIFAIKRSEYGDDFERHIKDGLVQQVRGSYDDRKNALAHIMSQGEILEVDDSDIQDCTVIVRKNGHQYTVHLLGESGAATRFPLSVPVPSTGMIDYDRVQSEMVRVLDDVITPSLSK